MSDFINTTQESDKREALWRSFENFISQDQSRVGNTHSTMEDGEIPFSTTRDSLSTEVEDTK